jgi:proteasome lid subunit RPN8/RPN11
MIAGTTSPKEFYKALPATAAHRAETLKHEPGQSAGRSTRLLINHYQCTDWLRYNNQTNDWDYAYTTCQYMDSFEVPDGSGVIPGGGKVVGLAGRGPDALIKGCGSSDPANPDKTPIDRVANTAEYNGASGNANYERAGFVVRGPDNQLWYTQGELLPLDDNLATVGTVADHQANLPPGYTIIGLYHSHPNTNPSMTDSRTGTHLSQADVDYANANSIDIYVIDLWNDTTSGTNVEKTAYFRYEKGAPPNTDKDVGSAGKCS